jgi:hypothetical protein
MVEAKHQLQLGRALSRWARYDLIALDEVGYVPLAEVGAGDNAKKLIHSTL